MAYLEPIIGGVAAFLLGFLWYTALFGKAWQAETGMTDEEAQSNMARTHGLAFLMMVIMSYAVNIIINYHDPEDQTFLHGGFHGLMAGLFYAAPAIAINYLYQRKSLKLYLIDAAYMVLLLGLSGGVMALLKLG
ncbi:MAG: DUF1761 domain-containing protein [Bacteroidia bacterium]|nr:DUF1761 domain-containing protein [Bacteroidia bacterium]MBT8230706.1 DUF1761 domain-containing protein [Bacteroidia bacterium]